MFNVQFLFSYNKTATFAQKIVILQQTTGDGVFYGNNSQKRFVAFYSFKNIFKCFAGNNLNFFSLKILTRCNFVKCSTDTLNGNSFSFYLF